MPRPNVRSPGSPLRSWLPPALSLAAGTWLLVGGIWFVMGDSEPWLLPVALLIICVLAFVILYVFIFFLVPAAVAAGVAWRLTRAG